ncbi:MAG: YigZ family protein [Pseudomonadota bacterium]
MSRRDGFAIPRYTVLTETHALLEEKKSRFLAFLVPYARFEDTLTQLKADHRKANHHVTAFRRVLPDDRIEESAKDDGEPGGTSGMPVLKTLIGADLVDAGIIVVRYFGGTKLGTGGLARAYSGAAAAAIDAARLEPWQVIDRTLVPVGFAELSDLEARLAADGLAVLDRQFTEAGVEVLIEGPRERVKRYRPDA